jgi:hypothetical protein
VYIHSIKLSQVLLPGAKPENNIFTSAPYSHTNRHHTKMNAIKIGPLTNKYAWKYFKNVYLKPKLFSNGWSKLSGTPYKHNVLGS